MDNAESETPAPKSVSVGHDAQRRMIVHEAVREITETGGVALDLDYLNFEGIAEAANVARSTAYRLWENGRIGFRQDVLLELVAGLGWFGTAAFDEQTVTLAADVVASRLDELATLEGRQSIMREAIRVAAEQNFKALLVDPRWRTYVAIAATTASTKDDEFRQRLTLALEASERQFIANMARFYDNMAVVLGMRLRGDFSFADLAATGAAVVEGLALRHQSVPSLVTKAHYREDAGDEPWTLAAVGFLGIISEMVELDDEEYDVNQALGEYFRRATLNSTLQQE